MKRLLLILSLVLLCSACTSTRLYYWGSNGETTLYEELAYQHYDKQTPESICKLVCLYEDMTLNPGGTRMAIPPGICAEYGFLLLQPETANIFATNATKRQKKMFSSSNYSVLFAEKGIQMLEKEMTLYPESATFITPLLKKFKH